MDTMERIDLLNDYIVMIQDPDLMGDVHEYLSFYREKAMVYPSSTRYHHTYEGGYLDHVLEVCDLCVSMYRMLGEPENVNLDCLLVAALIHDTSKLAQEYYKNKETGNWEKNRNIAFPHELFPIIDWGRRIGTVLPDEVILCVMSHMGGWSTTGIYPDELSCAILHSADLISSRLAIDRAKGRHE